MAFEEVEKGPEEHGRYWNPEEIGDQIEGNIYKFVTDDYGNKRIDLYLGVDEEDEPIMCMLPAHADLKRYYVNLERGDMIKVTLVKLIEPKGKSQYPKRIYKLLKDDSQKVEWPKESEDEDDDYFE